MDVFDEFAAYYDLLYLDKDYSAESKFIHSLILEHYSNRDHKNERKILELGCGTGKHASILASLGYEVTGVDISHKMISLAELMRSKQSQDISNKLQFHQCDIRTFSSVTTSAIITSTSSLATATYTPYYDVVISIFHVFSYLSTNQDLEDGLRTAAKHLKSGGLLIFDCWYGPAVLTDRPINRSKTMSHSNNGTIITVNRDSLVTMLPNKNTVEVNQTIQVISTATNQKTNSNEPPIIRSFSEQHCLRYYFLPELIQALDHTGFIIDNNTNNNTNNNNKKNDNNTTSAMRAMEWMTKKELGFDTCMEMFLAEGFSTNADHILILYGCDYVLIPT